MRRKREGSWKEGFVIVLIAFIGAWMVVGPPWEHFN